MKRSLLMLLLTLGVAQPALAQGQEPPPPPNRGDIEQFKRLLEERLNRRPPNGERDEIEEQLQRLLVERQLELQAQQQRRDEWQQVGGALVEGEGVAAKVYADPLADRPRDEVVALLDDEDFNIREQAQAHLLMDDTLDPAAVRNLITRAKTDEQRYRLIRVAEHHVMRQVRESLFGDKPGAGIDDNALRLRQSASIGFSYSPFLGDDNPVSNTPGVTVTATMPGFPGHALLRVGDQVIAINGQTARGIRHRELITSWISNRIAFHQPGDTVTLTVIRAGETLDIAIVCAQGQALNLMYVSNGLDAAFRQREYTQMWLEARGKLVEGMDGPKVLTPAAQE